MDKKRLFKIRSYLGKTQLETARLMGVSAKAIQSFEQGWRNITPHIERQVYFLLYQKAVLAEKRPVNCWKVKQCSEYKRQKCPAWGFNCGQLCWFINGTICNGETQDNWQKKMKMCEQCEAFQNILPPNFENRHKLNTLILN